ncbi:unnamed protein product [Ambrosiozyma monospora]|uniref:Unnamed protein product n=1 Tax=Ambrosiozyma monospora TaxID=43982 RepID=A0ACB5T9U9_AMBMO|nr:unnamed protein product [Ambrosiozyma monospora]
MTAIDNKNLESQIGKLSVQDYDDEDYYSTSDSDSDYSDDEDYKNQTTSGLSSLNSNANHVHVSNKQVLKEKTEIFDRMDKISEKINIDQFLVTKHRITRDKAERATVEQVLDPRTLKFLSKLFKNGTITKINGCISTGKEANVYHAVNETTNKEFAIKIYKTSILVFKDRERYVDGEFRFRNSKNQSNPRKMVKLI